jgi:cytochrome c oxidase subunit 3/cytochrome o ubiquinol oxidase subunit 3
MSAALSVAQEPAERRPEEPQGWTRGQVGTLLLILAETSFFGVFLVAYLFYIGKSLTGPQPADVLELPIIATICLLSSSGTIVLAVRDLERGHVARFATSLLATILLGGAFIVFTALEWRELIFEHGLTISTNLFGTTFYSLVGFHAAHVCIGLLIMLLILVLAAFGHVRREHAFRVELVSWYWHFVDTVWIAVFTVIYVVGV